MIAAHKTKRGRDTQSCSDDLVLVLRPSLALGEGKKIKVCFCRDQDGFMNGLSMVNLVY